MLRSQDIDSGQRWSDRLNRNGSCLKLPRAGRSRPAQGGRRIGRSEQRRVRPCKTALMIASQNGHEQVVRVLLEAGADRNPNSNCGVMADAVAPALMS